MPDVILSADDDSTPQAWVLLPLAVSLEQWALHSARSGRLYAAGASIIAFSVDILMMSEIWRDPTTIVRRMHGYYSLRMFIVRINAVSRELITISLRTRQYYCHASVLLGSHLMMNAVWRELTTIVLRMREYYCFWRGHCDHKCYMAWTHDDCAPHARVL